MGAEQLTFVVIVPWCARITIRLSDQEFPLSMRTLQESGVFEWPIEDVDEERPDPDGPSG